MTTPSEPPRGEPPGGGEPQYPPGYEAFAAGREKPIRAFDATAEPPQPEGPPCPRCRSVNPPGTVFCDRCGKRLDSAASQQPASPPPPMGEPAGLPLPPPPAEGPAPVRGSPPVDERPPVDAAPYPMQFDIDYPERLSRLSTFFRGPLLLPAWLFLYLVEWGLALGFLAGWTTVFLKKRYPSWLFQANSGALGYSARLFAYGALLTDRFPSFDQDLSLVHLEYAEPPQHRLSRWRVFLWKLVLLLPHVLVLSILFLGMGVTVFLSWFAIMATGRYPRGLFAFATGVLRWNFRIAGYFASFNDRFPPFALSREAGPASNGGTVACGVLGFLAASGITAGIVAAVVTAMEPHVEEIDYAALRGDGTLGSGEAQGQVRFAATGDGFVQLTLAGAADPGDALVPVLEVPRGERVIVFEWTLRNASSESEEFQPGDARLTAEDRGQRVSYRATILLLNGEGAPVTLSAGVSGRIRAVFVVPERAELVSLRFTPGFAGLGGIRYDFE